MGTVAAIPAPPAPEPHSLLHQLRELCSTTAKPVTPVLPTGLPPIDAVLPRGGLACGAVHEWFGSLRPCPSLSSSACADDWTPPLALLLPLACNALAARPEGLLLWIGPRTWPYLPALAARADHAPAAPNRSLFIRADTPADRLWAADLALRSQAPAAVVIDGAGFDLPATRRLQLAAEAARALCLLARPPWELAALSAATTRWRVSPAPSNPRTPPCRRWIVDLLRCKGLQPAPGAPTRWTVEHDHATRAVVVVPDVLNRPGQPPAEEIPARQTG